MKEPFKPLDRGVSVIRPIDTAREKVSVVELAEHLGGAPLIREGREFKTNCLIPDHSDKNPSLYVNPDKNLWLCRGCNRGGGLIELACHAWGYDPKDGHQRAMAAANVLTTFGYELPQRPPSWFSRQERQREVRDLLAEQRLEWVRKLVFRFLWMPLLRNTPASLREEAAREGWEASLLAAEMIYERRMGE